MFKDNESKEILQSIDKRLKNIETMEKSKRLKNAIKKEDSFFETGNDMSAWLLIMLMLVIFGFKDGSNENKKEEDEE